MRCLDCAAKEADSMEQLSLMIVKVDSILYRVRIQLKVDLPEVF